MKNNKLTGSRSLLLIATSSILCSFIFQEVSMVRLVSLKIPKYTVVGQTVNLLCHYDLEGGALYSVKWYKDDKEFYRFIPGDDPPKYMFNLSGIHVDMRNSSDNVVVLKDIGLEATGIYRCEVSGEAPSFTTVLENAQMTVVDLPDDGPKIEGTNPSYGMGDRVSLNCTASKSSPAAQLNWQINGQLADKQHLKSYPVFEDENGLKTSTLGLHFKLHKRDFTSRVLRFKCIASIDEFYWRTNEEVLENFGRFQTSAAVSNNGGRISHGKRGASLSHGTSPVGTLVLLSFSFVLFQFQQVLCKQQSILF